MKKYILFLITILLLSITCISVSAEDVPITDNSIKACKSGTETFDGQICTELKELFGQESELLYSLSETENCKDKTSINVNGEQIVVYLSDFEVTSDNIFNLNTCDTSDEVCKILQERYGRSTLYSFSYEQFSQFQYPVSVILSSQEEKVVYFNREFVEDVEIGKCISGENTEDEVICHNMQTLYGSDSIMKYNTVKTEECKYELVLKLMNQDVVLYTSTDMNNDVQDDEIVDENIYIYTLNEGLHKGYPNNIVVDKLIFALGDEEEIKYSWTKTNQTPYSVTVIINKEEFVVYLSHEPTKQQINYLKDIAFSSALENEDNELSQIEIDKLQNTIRYLYIIFFLMAAILLCVIIILLTSRRSLYDRIYELEEKIKSRRW